MVLVLVMGSAMLSGCAGSKLLENRITCSVDKSEAHVVSKWGPIGVSSEIAKADAAVVCK